MRRLLGVLVPLALMATLMQVATAPSASADDPPADPTVILESAADVLAPTAPVMQVVLTPDSIVKVINPGGSVPVTQQCAYLASANARQVCVGSSGQLASTANDSLFPTNIKITNAPTRELFPPEALDWIRTEAVSYVSSTFGVQNDDLVLAYARPQIRAYIYTRVLDILNKALYSETLTTQEQTTFDAVSRLVPDQRITEAQSVLEEYNRFDADPCAYRPPPKPTDRWLVRDAEYTANVKLGCHRAHSLDRLFQITRHTPSVEDFRIWAANRRLNAGESVPGYGSSAYAAATTVDAARLMFSGETYRSQGTEFKGYLGLAPAAMATMGIALAALAPWMMSVSVAFGPAAWVIAAVMITIWGFLEVISEQEIAQTIKRTAAEAISNSDPLGINASKADYAGLDRATYQDPPGKPKAKIHQPAFQGDLLRWITEWTSLNTSGKFVPDPVTPVPEPATGEPPTGPGPSDLVFIEDGVARDDIVLRAPQDTQDARGRAVNGYRVFFYRNWLMVSECTIVDPQQACQYQDPVPRLQLSYLKPDGTAGQMALAQYVNTDDLVDRKLALTSFNEAGEPSGSLADQWSFQGPGGTPRTVTLAPQGSLLPQINLVPTVDGSMQLGQLLNFQANPSPDATNAAANGAGYSWTIEHLDDHGVAIPDDTVTGPANAVAFQRRFDKPGDYRAQVRLVGGTGAVDVGGSVDFSIARPVPQVVTAELRDDRIRNGALFLNLRLREENTPTDTFEVEVTWADDAMGNQVVLHYTVHCQDAGAGTCETGPLISPSSAPTNQNWSSSPTFTIPDDQAFLPVVRMKVTNSFGESLVQSFPVVGEHRPRMADPAPFTSMPVGTFSRARVTEVIPSGLVADQGISINAFVMQIADKLPESVQPDVEKVDGRYYLILKGEPNSDDMGVYTFYFGAEQEPAGSGYRAAPALVTLNIVPTTQTGFRALLRNTPSSFADRFYRNTYPDFGVQAAYNGPDPDAEFTGVITCKLTASGSLIFEKPCAQDAPFPWPNRLIDGGMVASVVASSSDQDVDDTVYSVSLNTTFISADVSIDPAKPAALSTTARLALSDRAFDPISGRVPTPYSKQTFPDTSHGYQVTCGYDGKPAWKPCLDNGTLKLLRVPGSHQLKVRVVAPDDATTTQTITWKVATPARKFQVTLNKASVKPKASLRVKATGLLPRESYKIRIGSVVVAKGKSNDKGKVNRVVTVRKAIPVGKRAVKVVGATTKRYGQHALRVR